VTKNVSNKTRLTGIDVLKAVPWGTHICHFYKTKNDISDILVSYFKAGLESNEYCLWITADSMGVDEAKEALGEAVDDLDRYLENEQILIMDHKVFYMATGRFDVNSMLQTLVENEQFALSHGFDGLRISGNVSWLTQQQWPSFIEYELLADSIIRRRRIIAICSYSLEDFEPAEVVDTVCSHQLVLIRRTGRWRLIQNTGNAHIINLRNSGLTYAEIGQRVGLSRQRIAQIVNAKSREPYSSRETLLSAGKAATLLNVHINTIRRWGDNGILPVYRLGNRRDRKFRRTDLDKFIGKGVATQ